jgi:hypothetical protein
MGFIKGQWINGGGEYFLKFSHIERVNRYNKIWGTELKRPGSPLVTSKLDYWANSRFEKHALNNPVTIEDLRLFLPEGHPDLNIELQYEIY